MICKLATEDGCVLTGLSFGASGTRTGEIVFNTSMTGYQEILTDPSYCEQIVVMTFPLMGNYGVNLEDVESGGLHLSGMAIKELPDRPSSHRATAALAEYLAEHGIVGIRDIDTRALTRRIRERGAVRGVVSTEVLDDIELVRLAAESKSMVGANLTTQVESPHEHDWKEPASAETTKPSRDRKGAGASTTSATPCHIVAIDCGIKSNILRHLTNEGDRVTVVPGSTSASRIRDLAPDGILVGNGPGDPAAVTDTVATLSELIGTVPFFGICLGHQMLALALGAETYKLKFGHHGANVPVRNIAANRVEITSQNHGFAVDSQSLQRCGGAATHLNLNDGSLEGFVHTDRQIAALQFHPEASPGPNDSAYVFRAFVELLRNKKPLDMNTLFSP